MDNRYNQYKKSECIWLEDIPDTWRETRLKYVLTKKNYSTSEEDELLICSNKGEVFFRGESRMGLVADDDGIYQGVRPGNLLIHGMDTWHGAIAISKYRGKCTPVVHVCETDENKKYVMYYLQALAFLGVYKKITNGVRENTSDFRSWSKAGDINLLLPSRDEQSKIADYLDWKNSSIKGYIREERKQLLLMRELLDSRVNELQKAGNKSVRLDRLVELKYSPVEIHEKEMYRKAGMHNRGQGIFLREPILGKDVGDSKFQKIERDTLLFSGQFAWEGAVYIAEEDDEQGIVSHRYYCLKQKTTSIPIEYIWAYFMSEKGNLDLNNCSHGAAGRNKPLNINEVLKLYIPVPEGNVDYCSIQQLVRAIMQTQKLNKKKHSYLEELRRKNIVDVTLGKVDVRNAIIPKYEQVDESDELFEEESSEG